MIADLRSNSMIAHLLDALAAGTDIGHYGRLVFVMVARYFASDDELVTELTRDPTCSQDEARRLIDQVRQADYSPPKREKILDFSGRQDFPILPDAHDPDAGNVYKDLQFPDHVYEHIGEYRDAKAHGNA